MRKKDQELLLKVLCAMLPYGFTVHRYGDNSDHIFKRNEIDQFAHFLEYSEGMIFKPYLRPLSSMTEKEQLELKSIAATINEFSKVAKIQDYFWSHHLDYTGLIVMGLALEAPEGMYEK